MGGGGGGGGGGLSLLAVEAKCGTNLVPSYRPPQTTAFSSTMVCMCVHLLPSWAHAHDSSIWLEY